MVSKIKIAKALACVTIAASILSSQIVNALTFEEDTILTLEQKDILDRFRNLVNHQLPHDYMKEEIYLVKYLRSKNFDIAQAQKLLLDNLEWRKQTRMDTIAQEDWSDFEHDFKYSLEGRDKFERPILYIDVSTIDVRAAVIRDGERFLRYSDKVVEECCQLIRQLGSKYKNITRGHLMVNLNGYNTVQHGCLQCIPFLLRMVVSFRDHNPESLDKLVIINAPSFVEPLLNTLRVVMSPGLQQRLKVYGRNKQIWRAELDNEFDFTTLPPGAKANFTELDYDF